MTAPKYGMGGKGPFPTFDHTSAMAAASLMGHGDDGDSDNEDDDGDDDGS